MLTINGFSQIEDDSKQQDSIQRSLANITNTLAIDSIAIGWQAKLDSLKQQTLTIEQTTLDIDSLSQNKLLSINKLEHESDSIFKRLGSEQNAIANKLTHIENSIVSKQDALHQVLITKLNSLKKQPKVKNPVDSQWQNVNKFLPAEQLNGQQEKLGDLQNKTEELDKLTNGLNQYKLDPQFSEQLNKELKALDGLKQHRDKLKGNQAKLTALKEKYGVELAKLTKHKQKLSGISEKLNGYQQQVKQVDVLAENRVQQLEQVQAFEQQKAAFAPQLGEIEQLKDQDYAKQKLVDHSKKAAVDHFADQQEKLQAAQSKLKKLKQKIGKLNQVSGDEKSVKKQNEMKGKTLRERLVIGGNFQIQPGKEVALDISSQLAYRITKHINIGIGGTYRTSFDEKEKFWLSDKNETFGYRGFVEHDVRKGIFIHGEYERLKNQGIPDNDETKKKWHEGALLGIGKHYKIRNKIKGNVMLLYNFMYDVDGPYPKPWNIRFGFEIINKKKEQRNEIEKNSNVKL